MSIYVFKTSLCAEDIYRIDSVLRSIIPGCLWTYDLEDCDNILRIKSTENIVEPVCLHLKKRGIYCEELE